MKKILFFLSFLFLTCLVIAQEINLNQYKYVIVNSKFDFVKRVDGYQTSSFTKFLFNKKGFVTFLDNEEFNDELSMNRCMAVYADVNDDSGLLNTKLYIEVKDCKGRLLYKSPNGVSRLKKYVRAYRQAIREAFIPLEKMNYT